MLGVRIVIQPVEVLKSRPELMSFPETKKLEREILVAQRHAHLSKIAGLAGTMLGLLVTTSIAGALPAAITDFVVSGISVGVMGSAAALTAFALTPLVLAERNRVALYRQAREKSELLQKDAQNRHRWSATEDHIRQKVEANVARSMVARFSRAVAMGENFQPLSNRTVNGFSKARLANKLLAAPQTLPVVKAERQQNGRQGRLAEACGPKGRTLQRLAHTYSQA